MSHNKIKVAGQAPNSSGDIDVGLADLGDITGTLAANTYLKYDGANFAVTTAPGSGVDAIFIGAGETDNYPRTLSAGDEVCFYDTNPYEGITGATLNLLSGETDWYESVTLPAGTYYFRGTLVGDFTASASPNATYRFRISTTNYGSFGAAYDDIASGGAYPYESAAMITLSSSSTVYLRLDTVSSANSTTTSNQSKHGHLFILKVA